MPHLPITGKSQQEMQLLTVRDTPATVPSKSKNYAAGEWNQPECSLLRCKQPPLRLSVARARWGVNGSGNCRTARGGRMSFFEGQGRPLLHLLGAIVRERGPADSPQPL